VKKKELIQKIEQLIDSMNDLQRLLEIEQQENKELKQEIENLKIKLQKEKNKAPEIITVTKEKTNDNKGFVVMKVDDKTDEEIYRDAAAQVPDAEETPDVPTETEEETTEESLENVDSESVNDEEGNESVSNTEEETPETTAETGYASTDHKITEEALKLGAVAIGTIVQESIRYTAVISSSGSENKKELLSLIMGKGEMAKAEIFSIAQSESSEDIKRELIESTVKETVDYFKSVAAQI
jgi:hypothetical protein